MPTSEFGLKAERGRATTLRLNTTDRFGYFTFKKTGENTTEIVRYSP